MRGALWGVRSHFREFAFTVRGKLVGNIDYTTIVSVSMFCWQSRGLIEAERS